MKHLPNTILFAVALTLSACGGSCDDTNAGWELDEDSPFQQEAEPNSAHREVSLVIPEDRSACAASRQFIAELELVDTATLNRRPTDKVVEILEDVGADGRVERCWIRLYDEDGREVLTTQDTYDPPGPDSIYWVLEFDERAGKPTRYRADTDGDGVFDYEGRSYFDDRGLLVESSIDRGIDGTIDQQGWYSFDEEGHRTKQEADRDGDGVVDGFDVFETDEEGRITKWDADWDADGVWDQHQTWTFAGRETVEYWEERLDETTETHVALRTTTELDDEGRPVLTETDYGDDGTVDMTQRSIHEVNITTTTWDFENDGIIDNIEITEWDDDSQPANRRAIYDDYGNDGVFDQIRRFGYDAQGRQIVYERLDPVTCEVAHRQTKVFGD